MFQLDLKHAFRAIRRSPVMSTVAILSLALGIGAATAIFTVVNQVLLQAVPYKQADRLFDLREYSSPRGLSTPVSPANMKDWESRTHVFEGVALTRPMGPMVLTGTGEPVSVFGYEFSHNTFDLLGIHPMLGRAFTADEDQYGKNNVVVLGHPLWVRVFNSDRSIVGRSVTFSGKPYTVVGVMPPEFRSAAEMWAPIGMSSADFQDRRSRYLRPIARLRDGVTAEQAQRELNAVAAELEKQHPDTNAKWRVELRSVKDDTVGDIRPVLLALFSAVVLLLLIACTNVANLLMTKATQRKRETAIRVALGATRSRLIRVMLTESILLSVIGGVLGLAFAWWGTNFLMYMFPKNIFNLSIPKIEALPIDRPVLLFCLGASLATGLLFGIMPATQHSVVKVMTGLRESGFSYSAARSGHLARATLVVTEIALALVLLTGAGLALKTYKMLSESHLGFDPDHVLSFYIMLPDYKYKDENSRREFIEQVQSKVAQIPGVESAGGSAFLPLSGFSGSTEFEIEGQENAGEKVSAEYQTATPGYFESMRIPLLAGRTFTPNDRPKMPDVVVVNQTFVKQFFKNENAIGRRLNFGTADKPDLAEVVGVVGDVKSAGLDNDLHPEVTFPFAQAPFPMIGFAIRTAVDPDSVMGAARQAVWSVDKDQPVIRVISMQQAANEAMALRRITTVSMLLFAGISMILACLGVYGVIAFNVAQRSQEFGIRLALGATPNGLLTMVVKQTARLGAVGIAIGLAIAIIASKAATALVYGVSTRDPLTFVASPLILFAVAVVAGFVPAVRASRADPNAALRGE